MIETPHKPVKHTFIVTIDAATVAAAKHNPNIVEDIHFILAAHDMRGPDGFVRKDGLYYKKEFLF